MLAENEIIRQAKNTAEALNKYLIGKNVQGKFIRSGHKQCEYCVTAQFEEEGRIYKHGNRVWYKLL